jgi:hypothetical protein
LTFDMDYDDAFVLWINGREVARVNVAGSAGDPVSHNVPAESGAGSSQVWTETLRGADLPVLAGTNVVALQMFNVSLTSSDLEMDLEMTVLEGSTVAGDGDGDGMADAWEMEKLSGTASDGRIDSDGDGALDVEEYVLGTDPDDETSYLAVSLSMSNGSPVVSFPALAVGGTGYEPGLMRHHRLECRLALGVGAGLWQAVPGHEDIVGANVTYVAQTSGAELAYYRVRVWLE